MYCYSFGVKGHYRELFWGKLHVSSLIIFLVILAIQTALQKLLGNKLLIAKVFPVFDYFMCSLFCIL